MTPVGDWLKLMEALIRAFFVRVFHVRVMARLASLLLLFTPGVVWGALGGRRPLLGGLGDTPPVGRSLFVLGPFKGLLPPLQGGLGGL